MKGKYFGYRCKYFIGQWDWRDVAADTEQTYHYMESEPEISFCDHPENKDQSEGNCCEKLCPLNLKKK